jgi:DNA (cytosine-5)-methyltransferase 1
MNELALFAGAGGGILGGKLLGWRTVCAVEWEQYPACVLAARQNDGFLPPFPIWDDVQTFDGKPWRGIVDVISGGFPCQDISAAGKGAGIDGERSGMWEEMARIISEVRPQYAFIENSPMLTSRGLERVLADLAKMGFDAEWGVLSAADVGANHQRERIWIVGKDTQQHRFFSHTKHNWDGWGQQQSESIEEKNGTMANARCKLRSKGNSTKLDTKKEIGTSSAIHNQSSGKGQFCNTNGKDVERQWKKPIGIEQKLGNFGNSSWWEIEPNVGRVANGVAFGVDRLKAIGNGQVSLCAATAWELLMERLNGRN